MLLKSIFNRMGVKTRTGENVQPAGPLHFEPLEPRLLLNADLTEPVPLSSPEAPLGGGDLYVDLNQQDDEAQGPQALELFSTSPALFVENQGQWADSSVRYVHDGNAVDVAVLDSGLWFQATRQDPSQEEDSTGPAGAEQDPLGAQDTETQVLQFSTSFVGADLVQPTGLEPSESLFNYYVGDQADWRQNVPSYGIVAYEGLYEGVDLYVQGLRSHLKYEFHVAPGADYGQIEVRYEGIQGLSLAEDGSLLVDLGGEWGVIRDDAPYLYQEIDGRKVEVAGRFILLDDRTYSFRVTGTANPKHELVIDPDLAWSTYLGGSGKDFGTGVAVDASGNVLVTGLTESSGWISGGFDTSFAGGRDAFVVKLSPDGAHLWSTYLGGLGWDYGNSIAVDGSGSIYVTGYTNAYGWTSGGFDTTHNGESDAFVAKLAPGGAHLWSTYLGGTNDDDSEGIAVDTSGNVYVTGRTASPGWANGGFDTTYNGGDDAFVAKLSSSGAHLWSTYLGGSEVDYGQDIATDASGGIYVTGTTFESPVWTSGGFDTTPNGVDAFVVKLDSGGAHLWSTYVGGEISDYGEGIAVDASGVYVTGQTGSSGWTSGGFDTTFNGGGDWGDAFMAKLSSTGAHLWSTYLGGSGTDWGYDIAIEASGGVYVTGLTESSAWTSGGFDTTFNGGFDAFVVKLSSGGAHLWSTYLGGDDEDYGWGIAVDSLGAVYVTGLTSSSGWVSGGLDTSYNGGTDDAFVAKIDVPSILTDKDSITVAEGSMDILQVKLSAAPAGDVTVTVSRVTGDDDINIADGSSLTFTTANWDTYQTVTLSAAEDADATNGTATIRCSAAGLSDKDVMAVELDNDSSLAPVYRFWSPVHSRHFYTIDETERDKLINQYSHVWTYEGPAYQAYADDTQPDVAPIYRFWSGTLNAHFYTIDQAERDKLVNQYSHVWTYEGVAFYAYAAGSEPVGTSAVYRFWSGTLNCHFFTMDQAERDKLINLYPHVWTYEQIAWYAFDA